MESKSDIILDSSFDKSKFSNPINIVGVKIPSHMVGSLLKGFKEFLLNMPKFPNIAKDYNEANHKLLLLNQAYNLENKAKWSDKLLALINENNFEIMPYILNKGYEDLNMIEVLERILPEGMIIPSGFEIIGSIAHLNLKGEQLKYKRIIGEVLLDKNEKIRTVVNKKEALSNVYRTPELEIIAGDMNLETELKEGGCIFRLNVEKVYWCSRLQSERDRILLNLNPKSDVLCDMFCGIGPLSLRAAKKGLYVLANDLNPSCYEYLNLNTKLNKLDHKVKTYNMDAREFLVHVAHNDDPSLKSQFKHFTHIYMNLPADAVEFLDVFKGFLHYANKAIWNIDNLPIIHVYGFEIGEDMNEIKDKFSLRIKNALGGVFHKEEILDIHTIKDVSSLKRMFCVKFRLSKEVALLGGGAAGVIEPGDGNKKQDELIKGGEIEEEKEYEKGKGVKDKEKEKGCEGRKGHEKEKSQMSHEEEKHHEKQEGYDLEKVNKGQNGHDDGLKAHEQEKVHDEEVEENYEVGPKKKQKA